MPLTAALWNQELGSFSRNAYWLLLFRRFRPSWVYVLPSWKASIMMMQGALLVCVLLLVFSAIFLGPGLPLHIPCVLLCNLCFWFVSLLHFRSMFFFPTLPIADHTASMLTGIFLPFLCMHALFLRFVFAACTLLVARAAGQFPV